MEFEVERIRDGNYEHFFVDLKFADGRKGDFAWHCEWGELTKAKLKKEANKEHQQLVESENTEKKRREIRANAWKFVRRKKA